ncbi:MAG: protein translocase subunit SecF [Patescibacteria group bacterium]|jgi:preprotein translocase subunit SecF
MNIVRATKVWLGISSVLVVAALVCIFTFRYNLGIDFAGGTALEISTGAETTYALPENTTASEYLVSTYKAATGQEAIAQSAGATERWILRSKSITNDQKNAWLTQVKTGLPNTTELQFTSVSPTVGADVVRKAILAVIVAMLAILIYLAYAFRKVPKPTNSWRFGATAVVALLAHDVVILLGVYSLLSHFFGAEIDGMFITALLTLLGFSVHDTIVTYDRLRENLIRKGAANFEQTVNDSIVETITRSINTTFTLVLVLLAMTLMGGRTTFFFTLSLLIGVILGTYSSIFVASPLLLMWQNAVDRQKPIQ